MLADNNLICSYSRRQMDNMSLSYGDTQNSLDNRKRFLSGLGIDYRDLVCAKQVHASYVSYATEAHKGSGALTYDNAIENTDAFITDKPGVPLAIFTADCLSVFLYDPNTRSIGLAHAGWRSTRENIIGKTVNLMQKEFGLQPLDLQVSFGPGIRGCCYEVDDDFSGYFPSTVIRKDGRLYLDLAATNKKQAVACGVKAENIFDPTLCTFCKADDFFSFRKEGQACGRMMSVIMLKN